MLSDAGKVGSSTYEKVRPSGTSDAFKTSANFQRDTAGTNSRGVRQGAHRLMEQVGRVNHKSSKLGQKAGSGTPTNISSAVPIFDLPTSTNTNDDEIEEAWYDKLSENPVRPERQMAGRSDPTISESSRIRSSPIGHLTQRLRSSGTGLFDLERILSTVVGGHGTGEIGSAHLTQERVKVKVS